MESESKHFNQLVTGTDLRLNRRASERLYSPSLESSLTSESLVIGYDMLEEESVGLAGAEEDRTFESLNLTAFLNMRHEQMHDTIQVATDKICPDHNFRFQ